MARVVLHQYTPHSTDLFRFWLAVARFMLGQFDDAIALMKQAQGFEVVRRLFLAAAYAALDRREEAAAETRFVMAAMPEFRVSQFGQCQIFARAEDRDRPYLALCKAGLPE